MEIKVKFDEGELIRIMDTHNLNREKIGKDLAEIALQQISPKLDELLQFEKVIDRVVPHFEAYLYNQEHHHYGEWDRRQTEAYNLCVRKCRENLRKLLREGTLVYSDRII